MKKILVFQPFSGIWRHSVQEISAAVGLRSSSFELSTLTCGGLFREHCTVRESRKRSIGSKSSRLQIDCLDCKFAAGLTREVLTTAQNKNLGSLEKYSIPEDILFADEIVRKFQVSPIEMLLAEEILGFPLVRISLYETLLKFKKRHLELDEIQRRYFEVQLHNAILTVLASKRFFKNNEVSIVLTYSPQYTVTNVFAHVAKTCGAKVLFLEGSSNLYERNSHIRVWNWFDHGLVNPALQAWPGANNFVPSSIEAERVHNHFKEISRGVSHSVYSPNSRSPENLRTRFGIPEENKIIVLALSSFDEAYAALIIGAFPVEKFKSKVFKDQFEWVRETIKWAANKAGVTVIIRLHPRDLPTQRENVRSEQIDEWEGILDAIPENIRVDHPSEKIPIADYWQECDTWVTGWSSTALEAMYQGVDVVTYDSELPSFPKDIHRTGSTKEEYFGNLSASLLKPNDPNSNRDRCINWLTFAFCKGTFEVTTTFGARIQRHTAGYMSRLFNAMELVAFPVTRTWDTLHVSLFEIKSDSLSNLIKGAHSTLFEVPESKSKGSQE